MTGPPKTEPSPTPNEGRVPSGSFVTDDLQQECARFLVEVRSLVHRRSQRERLLQGSPAGDFR